MPAARLLARAVLAALPALVVAAAPATATPPTAAGAAAARTAITAAQERVVLRLVDDLCGDTWCEGEHAFRFRSFTCHPRRGCVLRVRLAPWSSEPLRWHDRSARILGFSRYRDMVATAPGGHRSLQPAFTEAVGRAIGTMTAGVP